MNISLSAYTSLETLLLFQSLRIHGVEGSVFGKISDLLKKNRYVRSAKEYDEARLSPDALRDLYQTLVEDEGAINADEGHTSDIGVTNGDHPNSRKRKVPIPSLPSAVDAAQNPDLIPKLVEKLYYRYRSSIAEEVGREERKWSTLKQEVEEIESGKWDHKLKIEATNGLPSKPKAEASSSATKPSAARERPNALKLHSPVASSAPPYIRPLQSSNGSQPVQYNGRAAGNLDISPHTKASSSPAPAQAAQSRPTSQNIAPAGSPPVARTPVSQYSPPVTHQSPYVTPVPPSGISQNTRTQLANAPGLSAQTPPHSAQSLHNLQPSSYSGEGQRPFSPSPSRYIYPLPSQHAGPQGSAGHSAGGPSSVTQPPGTQRTPQYHPPAYPSQPSTQQRQPPGSKGGVMLPPFQVTPQTPLQQQQRQDTTASPLPPRQTLPRTPSTVPSRLPTQTVDYTEVIRILGSKTWRPNAARPSPLTAVNTPSSETKWKKDLPTVATLRSPSVSPINDLAPPPAFPVPGSRPRGRPRKVKPKAVETTVEDDSRSIRSTRRRGRRPRGASVTSSAVESSVRGRTRSQSAVSHVDAMSVDESHIGHAVKHEPSTPGMLEDVMPGIESAASGLVRRNRNVATSAKSTKRKREAQEESEAAESEEPGSPGSRQIVAPRYFHKMSQPLLNDITSHKYASLFSAPVKEKDAAGYKDMIKRPQDLKSIRTAINVGSKVVAAAAASMDTPSVGSPGGGGGNVLLPVSAEVMPPKAIVNSAQLERELMRMFANAVMFNTGEDGVVQDARDMFEATQQAVSNWRSAERTRDGEEVGAEDEGAGPSKRRKQ
ncbi:hypothetical protein EJ05DRAFT_202333 [Pseudovirgaria hyperparasitica]|uniref:Bromo domain-containing protein n=1 Tax=Pseudovirgaria hyperparasitica TaxID=470096 RepID=A0A6A6WHH7_9PEZI|nr:uncharacterized protein EJ05DRAFT_202333 [Pseudovirgaria hyperparasitica]KAF2762248.1 hypothetical protein EJ05DRAFT_202333 [Pseudovirgaria hyperparasitica]